MASKYFRNKARRTYWVVHIEAWRRSNLPKAVYCRDQRIDIGTFDRWLKAIGGADAQTHKPSKKRKNLTWRVDRGEIRSKAVQAFWAMHVEALRWSGLSAAEYCRAHRLTPTTLREWRGRLDSEPMGVDWRELVHPSARPYVGSRASTSAKAQRVESALTAAREPPPVRDGRSSRRSFTDEEKLAIVLEAEKPGATVSAVARRHGVVTSMLFRWRVQFGFGKPRDARFADIRLAQEPTDGQREAATTASLLETLLPIPEGTLPVDLPDGRRVFAPAGSDPEAVRQYVAERERARC